MDYKEFDDKIKSLMENHSESVDEGIWSVIDKRLTYRKRVVFIKKAGLFATAAAIIGGIFLFINPQTDTSVTNQTKSIAIVESPIVIIEADSVKPDVNNNAIAHIESKEVAHISSEVVSTPTVIENDIVVEKAEISEKADTVFTPQTEAPVKKYKTISEQLAANEYLANNLNSDNKEKGTKIELSAKTNMYTINSSGNIDFTTPSFALGTGQNSNYGITPISTPKHFFPVSAGLQVQLSFFKGKMALGAGVNYTYLYSTYEALVDKAFQGNVEQELHYIGVPIDLYYNIISTDNLIFYANIGGAIEKGLQAGYKVVNLSNNNSLRKESINGVQLSANVGIGFEYRFIKSMGVFIDPKLTYFFDCEQPYSIRSEQPLQFNLELGFRFHLK